jgi:ATP-binding cassette subfamily C (CFTR/MRP) protein 4
MDEPVPLVPIYTFGISLSLCLLFQTLLDHQINFRSIRIGIRIRNALTSLIFTRILSIKSTLWQHVDTGHVISLIANDAYRFEEICIRLHVLWVAPLEALIIFGFLCWIIHPIPTIVGYLAFFLSIVILILIGHHLSKYREMILSCNDKRIRAYNEFIHGSQIIESLKCVRMN